MDAKILKAAIPPEYVLPCDFIVGAVVFRKGVKLETVRQAAARWHSKASEVWALTPAQQTEIRKLVNG